MGEQDHRLLCNCGWNSARRIGPVLAGAAHPREPQTLTVPFERNGSVGKDWEAVVLQAAGDEMGTGIVIVIAQGRITERTLNSGEDLGAVRHTAARECLGHGSETDEVTDQHDHVRPQFVDSVYDLAYEVWLGVLGIMEVRNLDNAHATKGIGKTREMDRMLFDHEFVARDFAGIERKTSYRCSGECKERTPGEAGRRRRSLLLLDPGGAGFEVGFD